MTQEACAEKQEEVKRRRSFETKTAPQLRRLSGLNSYLVLTGSAVRVVVAGNVL